MAERKIKRSEMAEGPIRNMEALFDLRDGIDVGSRTETEEPGAGAAGYEPCLGHNENMARNGWCPCDPKTGLIRSRKGTWDPYLVLPLGPKSGRLHPTAAPPQLDPPRETPEGEHIPLTTVERSVARRLRVRVALDRIRRLERRAPQSVLAGIPERDREAMEWFAQRMYVPNVVA